MKPFEIGLTLTGSVSAGAYTAGVIDFLLEALDEWEKKKQANQDEFGNDYNQWDVPWHNVVITGLSGASGGGVTCGLLLNTIGKQIVPVKTPPKDIQVQNDLYETWVNQLGVNELTDLSDLQGTSIKSLLNSNSIVKIADNTLKPGQFGNQIKRNYIANNLKVIITVTNLRGIPYWLKTTGIGANTVIYKRHTDYLKFELSNNDVKMFSDTVLVPYNMNNPLFPKGYAQLKAACLATCAFPAAFRARPVTQNESLYALRGNAGSLAIPKNADYEFLCGDGGILNTNPFELLHQDMLLADKDHNPTTGSDVSRSIIIVAPLETDTIDQDKYDVTRDNLLDVVIPTIAAIRGEAIFTDEQIALALNDDIYSRFIIAPVRYDKDDTPVTPPITGTTVNTFGAFLSKNFREHDYFLGRRNAQQFLRKNFAIKLDEIIQNPIFTPLNIDKNRVKFKNHIFFETKRNKATGQDVSIEYFCIIPLVGEADSLLFNPLWPTNKYNDKQIKNDVSKRIGTVIDITLASLNLPVWLNVVKFLAKSKIKSCAIDFVMKKIRDGLTQSKL